jgi:hypothetical protein
MNSEEKYIAVYGRDGTHISNIQLSKWNITRKVFDLDVSNFEGSCDEDITSGLIFVMNDKYGNKEYSGFMKSIVQDEDTGYVSFKGEDFKKILDTEVFVGGFAINFSSSQSTNYTLYNLMEYIMGLVENQASSLFTLNFTFPGLSNSIATTEFNIFDGSYFYTNVLNFIKPYSSYYGFYIATDYDIANKTIDISFVSSSVERDIRLEDFIFDQTYSAVKVNHTVARIKFDTSLKGQLALVPSTQAYYDAQAADNKTAVTDFAWFIDITDLPEGYAIKNTRTSSRYISGTLYPYYTEEYYVVAKADNVWVRSWDFYFVGLGAGAQLTINATTGYDSGSPTIEYPQGYIADDYPVGTAIKIDYPYASPYEDFFDMYFVCVPYSQAVSGVIEEKHYYLGLDNEVYEETITSTNQIYPVVTKYFEDDYIAKAQFNAIWELVNSRYNENVILDKVNAPVDITTYNLYDMITVYDSNGNSKELPVSEIRWTQDSYKVKLGFKIERLTDIVKEATGTKITGAISTKYSSKLIQDIGRLGNLSDIK